MQRQISALKEDYTNVRKFSMDMVKELEKEEFYDQAVEEVSPAAWNLGHTTWFFDAVILNNWAKSLGGKLWYHFNSYYKGVGKHVRQACRGRVMITEVSLEEIYKYRESVDKVMQELLQNLEDPKFHKLVQLGINHEQQHQELFFSEVQRHRFEFHQDRSFSQINQLESENIDLEWIDFNEAVTEVGNVEGGFGFDNEYGVHKAYINPFSIMSRPVTNKEFLEFIEDSGYQKFKYWLAASWDDKSMKAVLNMPDRIIFPNAPGYWQKKNNKWQQFTLSGWQDIDLLAPVSHVSYYEAIAYSKWKSEKDNESYRLPTEPEWEHAARFTNAMKEINNSILVDLKTYKPVMAKQNSKIKHMIGNVWEWTNSAYLQFPNYKAYEGTTQEYNGKFMSDKMVLKGGSWATPKSHIRISYRNFWPLQFRFAIPGFRLVKE